MIEGLRKKSFDSLFSMNTFNKCWPTWREMIFEKTNNFQDPRAIYNLGSHLREIFRTTGGEGRQQGDLSGGGAAWEALVCWYLNVVMIGSRAIVIKQSRSLIPPVISDAMSVTYKNVKTNTESDLSGMVFPQDPAFLQQDYDPIKINEYIHEKLSKISLHNIQCKTNWNDNAQIPMLWDMVYQFREVRSQSIRVGSSGVDLNDLADFTYSFVTVPSQNKEIIPNSMCVRRVESLSGGNYWGRSSARGVAESVSEIFKRVFGNAFDRDIKGHIAEQLESGAISIKLLDRP